MVENDIKRLSRLTAILIQLQTKRLLTASELANKYSVSVRTIYRDIKALEQAGVPVFTEEGRGYSLMEGYRIPPVMFTENEANALILAEQLVLKNKDASFVKAYTAAIDKIKAVLGQQTKEKVNLLSSRSRFTQNFTNERNSNYISELQIALTNCYLAKMSYVNEANKASFRIIEPFALINTNENWLLIAWCHTRKDYRYFRLDRIKNLEILSEKFESHNLTLQDFFNKSC